MSLASNCRVCLSNNKRMKRIANTHLQTIFENLTGNQLITDDRRPELVCYLCLQLLQRCCKFVNLSRRAEECLTHLLFSGVGLNRHALTINCTTVQNDSPYTLVKSVTNVVSITKNWEGAESDEVVVKADSSSEVPEDLELEEKKITATLDADGDSIFYDKKEEIKPDLFEEKSDSDSEDSDSSNVPLTMHRQSTNKEGSNNSEVTNPKQQDTKTTEKENKETGSTLHTSENYLQFDKRNRTGSFKCDKCPKAFKQRAYFKRHARIHTGEKPYKCDICGLAFTDSVLLKHHKRTHSGEAPFICNICSKHFNQKPHLTEHIRTHTGEKPYSYTISPGSLGNRSMKSVKLKQELNSSENASIITQKQSIKCQKPCRDDSVKKNAALTKDNRARIITLSEQGCSKHEISRQLNITRNTVKRWIKRHGEEGFLKDRRQHNKGPRRITDEQITEMKQHIEEHPFTPLHYFAARYDACLKTIRKCLYSTGFHHRLCKKVPLTDAQRLERLNFARGYLDFDWSNVIFSGEKSFTSQRNRLTLKRYSITQDREEQSNQLYGHNTASMWGWMSASGVGELVNISHGENVFNYVDLLEETLLPTVRTVFPQEDVPYILYVHENSPEHTARFVTEWFFQHPEIYVIPWPSKSQDLNPMENLWGLIIEMWDKKSERTGQEIEEYCNEIWEFVRGSEICSRLVGSMRARLQGVIESNGA